MIPLNSLMLRTCGTGGNSHEGFVWPLTHGALVTAPDWDPTPECGRGLHGLRGGEGDWCQFSSAPDAVWIVAVIDAEAVDLGDKIKVPRARVYYAGGLAGALEILIAAGADIHADDDAALHLAAGNGDAETVRVLIAAGADIHARGDYALRRAAEYGRTEIVELLTAAGEKEND